MPPPDHPAPSVNDLAVVQIVLGQMTLLEGRLGKKLDENAKAAKDRWLSHDDQHAEWEKALQTIGVELKAIGGRLDTHLRNEEDEDLVRYARLSPLRTAAQIVWRERVTLMLAMVVIADLLSRVLRIDLV